MLVDTDATLGDGTKLRLFAVESSAYSGSVNYRFQYYDSDTGDSFLRFDNSQVSIHGAGRHHRHEWVEGEEQVAGIEFTDLESHLTRFKIEVTEYDN